MQADAEAGSSHLTSCLEFSRGLLELQRQNAAIYSAVKIATCACGCCRGVAHQVAFQVSPTGSHVCPPEPGIPQHFLEVARYITCALEQELCKGALQCLACRWLQTLYIPEVLAKAELTCRDTESSTILYL